MGILSRRNVPIIVALLVLFILSTAAFIAFMIIRKRKKEEEDFINQVYFSGNASVYGMQEYEKKRGAWEQWCYYWGSLLKKSEIIEEDLDDVNLGLGILLISIGSWFLVSIFAGNIGLGLVPAILIPFGIKMHADKKIKAKLKKMEDQIPSFLSALKSNIQANQAPEQALIEAINTTSAPLYDELKIAKQFAATASFSTALQRLREETSSEDIRFLCSCIELSSKLGANMEHQLETIEQMIVERRELARLLDAAIRENKPLMIASSLILPLLFIYMYITSEPTRDFWFKSLASWGVFFGVIIMFSGAMWVSNKFIKELEEFR